MNKRHYEHTLPNIRGSLSNTYSDSTGIQYREMKQMRHINHCNTLQDRAVPTDGSFGIPYFMKTRMTGSGTERKEMHIQPLADRELQGKVGKRFFSDGKAGTLRVSRKNHPRPEGLRYFSRKPCLSGSVCRKALVVQRAAKARVSTIKMIKL